MPYNFVADSSHTKKLCSRLSSSEVRFYTENGRFEFLSPKGCLEATYDDHLRLIGKRVLMELFSLGVATELLYERISIRNRRFRSNGDRLTQNFR